MDKLNGSLVAWLWPVSSRPSQAALLLLMNQLGIGLGPFLAALSHQYMGKSDLLLVWGFAATSLFVMLWLILMSPRVEFQGDDSQHSEKGHAPEESSARRHRILGYLIMIVGRSYIVLVRQ